MQTKAGSKLWSVRVPAFFIGLQKYDNTELVDVKKVTDFATDLM